jgi:hypothetical protein
MHFRLFFFALFSLPANQLSAQMNCLPNSHSHNDYLQKHPLQDALMLGFASVEADVFLIHGELYVSHTYPFLKRQRLDSLYLEPLMKVFEERKGKIYDNASIILLIDIKSGAGETYHALKKTLKKYEPLLTKYGNGKITPGAVTIILSGNKPYDSVFAEQTRFAFIDRTLMPEEKDRAGNVCLMASTKYSNVLSWRGKGEPDANEKVKLVSLVEKAHSEGKKVRLWASPENKVVWKFLLDCGVDLINTNKLNELSEFLKDR